MYWRTCSAMKKKKLITCSGCPLNCLRSSGSCVAMPTEQVLRWHLRIMMQPIAIRGVVAKPNSSAPSSAAMATSRPVCSLPSVCTRMRLRRSFSSKTCCVSAKPEFPRNARVLDGTQRGRAGAATVSADEDDIGVSFGNARGNRAYADFRHQLHRDARLRIYVLQVVDQLRQIFDRIDIVMRRRRNQSNARDRVPQARDDIVNFMARKLATLAGFGALRHFDLQFVGVHQVVRSHSEARRGHLLDRAAAQIAVRVGLETLFIFSALAGVRLAADAVHGDCQSFVRFFADRSKRHGAGGKAFHDLLGGLDFFDRNRLVALLELHQAAQRAKVACSACR